MGHYGGECACCGITNLKVLSIDHINGGGLAHLRLLKINGGVGFYSWLKKNGYPTGYRVLCMNCNQAKGIYGHCPHESDVSLMTGSY
jgi:hypothetical protein